MLHYAFCMNILISSSDLKVGETNVRSRQLLLLQPSFILCIAVQFHQQQLLNLRLHWQWQHEKPTTLRNQVWEAQSCLGGAYSLERYTALLSANKSNTLMSSTNPMSERMMRHVRWQIFWTTRSFRWNTLFVVGRVTRSISFCNLLLTLNIVQQESTTTMQLHATVRYNAATVHNQSKLAATLNTHEILSECVFGRLSLVNEYLSAAAYIIHCYCAQSPPHYACNLCWSLSSTSTMSRWRTI